MQTKTRSVRWFVGMVAVLACQAASAADVSWTWQPDTALGITSHLHGAVWTVGMERQGDRGYDVYKWNGKGFVKQGVGLARKIAVMSTDQLWMVSDLNELSYQIRAGTSPLFVTKARDVAIGGDNSVWSIGTDERTGGYGVYQLSSANIFVYQNAGAVRVAADKSGNAWIVDNAGQIYMFNLASKTWEKKPGTKARSIHTGASSGSVWMIGGEVVPGGFPISKWNPVKQAWEPYGSYGAVDMTEAAGVPWIVQSDGRIYSQTQAITTPAPTAPAAPLVWPPESTQPHSPDRLTFPAKPLCIDTNGSDCGTTKADYVGKYTLDTSCDSGFYDPIYGGTCWKCPDDDGRGAWIRSLDAVDKDTACWRSPKETTGSATKVKSPAWAWECPSGSFWDGYSPDGAGGSCWKCPDTLPRRTAAAVWAGNACASSLNETSRATFLAFNGCPKPDPSTMSLSGKRSPGKPFLDIAAGWNNQVASGGCYACPITDETGNFLITLRNGNAIYNTDNSGCDIKMKWQPETIVEPGLSYMLGVKDLIWEQKLLNDTRISGFLYDMAAANGLGNATPEAREWVGARWKEIGRGPYSSTEFRTFIFMQIKAALNKKKENRTAAEKTLLDSFAKYIQGRRTYLAKQALGMYDAWKVNEENFRADTNQARSLGAFFYYGTVPLDFHGTLSGLMAVGGSGGSTIAALNLANAYAHSVQFTDEGAVWEQTVNGMLENLKLLQSAQGLKFVTGASILQVGFAILTAIAIDQFVAIETARPKLEAALALAQQPVDLDVLAASDNGPDELYLFWSRAMDTGEDEDSQVVTLAGQAQALAQQSGYGAPPKTNVVTAGQTPSDTLSSGATSGALKQGEQLVSKNGKYSAIMQADGNFVIYAAAGPIWSSNTYRKGSSPFQLSMQGDGNLVVYANGRAIWASGTQGTTTPFKLLMQDDGNLCIYDGAGHFVWETHTAR